jgi:ABC-type sugar transport system substrate-binding protein
MDMAVADFGTTLGPRSVSMLQKNPTTQVVVGPYDPAVSAMQGAARQAGITKVKWVGSNGDPSAIKQIKSGGPQVITLGQPFLWGGWAAVDTFVRLFAGQEPVDEKFPNRVMTIWDTDSLPDKGYWDGGLDFRAEYTKIWKK